MADDLPLLRKAGFFVRNARRLLLDHVQISGQIGEAFDIDQTVEADIRP
jgi:hypothetical protein